MTVSSRPGLHLLAVPTPFAIGPINAYLIEGSPLTLIDNGPNCATALAALEAMLAALGYRVEDLELLIVTHDHLEHFGLTATLAERSGASVAAFVDLADFRERWALVDDYIAALMVAHGVDAALARALRAAADLPRGFGAPVGVDRRLRDGDRLDLGTRELEVLHRPGHSPGDIVLLDAANRVLFSGDHLLSRVSSNALVTLPLGVDRFDGREPSLLRYRESLRATRALDVDLVLGGHGEPIVDHRALIDERLALHDRRAARFAGLLADGPRTAHELAVACWPEAAFEQTYLTLSETLGHLDLLIARGQVCEQDGRFALQR